MTNKTQLNKNAILFTISMPELTNTKKSIAARVTHKMVIQAQERVVKDESKFVFTAVIKKFS